MILSKDILNGVRGRPSFTRTIRYSNIFKKHSEFKKIFPQIGLNNFKIKIKNISGINHFMIKNTYHNIKYFTIMPPLAQHKSLGNKILDFLSYFMICGIFLIPITIFLNIGDYIRLHERKKSKKLEIVFSSDGSNGAWDIATMSMRGIKSCQSWGSTYADKLIGSIVDSCCGIIYLTDKTKTEHGSKMLHRSVVRYVVHKEFGPCLLMERTYPDDNGTIEMAFATVLHTKTQLPIIIDSRNFMETEMLMDKLFIPYSNSVIDDCFHEGCASYRDSKIPYQKISVEDVQKFPILGKLEL